MAKIGKIVYIPPEKCFSRVKIEETPHGYKLYIGGIVVASGYQLYRKYFADGKITLDEIKDIIDDVEEIVDSLPSKSELSKMKKADLIALCEKHGLDTDGVKAVLVERLLEVK